MNRRHSWSDVALALLLAGCTRSAAVESTRPTVPREAAVYAAAIEYLFVRSDTRQLLVAAQTAPRLWRFAAHDSTGAKPETWRAFAAHNQSPKPIPSWLPLKVRVAFADAPPPRLGESGRRGFVGYPDADGWIEVSGIGFDDSGSEAIVAAFSSCAGLCGNGGVLILRLRDDVWRVVSQPVQVQT